MRSHGHAHGGSAGGGGLGLGGATVAGAPACAGASLAGAPAAGCACGARDGSEHATTAATSTPPTTLAHRFDRFTSVTMVEARGSIAQDPLHASSGIVEAMPKRRLVLPGSLLAVIVAAAALITPYWVMQPFRSQSSTELAVALGTLRVAPWVIAAMALLALWMVVRAWPQVSPRWLGWARRVGTVLALLGVLATLGLSRHSPFEQMFAPLPGPTFVAVAEAPWAPDDVMMTVRVGDETRGYPVRVMAYHHVLNDELAGERLVVTY
jgi:hypothetical protein